MSIGSALFAVVLQPLQLVFETITFFSNHFVDNVGLSLIVLSLAINILVLPLYRRADAIQEEERETEERLSKWVNHIKKNFQGDERTMMLQTYYRQNNYNPAYVLRSAVSLFLEIPFFIAAYNFLSQYTPLNGVPFGPIADLAKPDGILKIGSCSINLLPVIMTGLNFISVAIFTKNHPLKTKIQLYGMAVFFLFFLYNSPSGLVFYWTLNNLFSLGKNVYYKLKNPGLVLRIASAAFSLPVALIAFNQFEAGMTKRAAFAALVAVCLWLPLALPLLKRERKPGLRIQLPEHNSRAFVLGCAFLTVLIGLLIPSTVIKASPQEFVDLSYYVHPLWYLAYSFLNAAGVFLLWFRVFYRLASDKVKSVFDISVWIICGVASVNYFLFGANLGFLSSDLTFESELSFSLGQIAVNCLVILFAAAILAFVYYKWNKLIPRALALTSAAILCMSLMNSLTISKSIDSLKATLENTADSDAENETPHFTLSKTGKNVAVIMLDRAIGAYIPYLFNEKPELAEQYSGFTYYSNVISYGIYTNIATPALFGGYEYTPAEMNKRDSESLESKHNEALKVMPVLFASNGYDVTVIDPPYAGYQWIPDLSIYDEYPDIHTYLCESKACFSDEEQTASVSIENRNRNFFVYGLMKSMPLLIQPALYNQGRYCNYRQFPAQIIIDNHTANGTAEPSMSPYNSLKNMSTMTSLTDEEVNTFMMMDNNFTHQPLLLQEPGYDVSDIVDNTEYDQNNSSRFTVDGKTLIMDNIDHYSHYQTNMAAIMLLGEWIDYLKSEGVYDNTRIIIASDHGRALRQLPELELENGNDKLDIMAYYPLLMVKDFNSEETFSTSDTFMTNADVPTIAVEGLIASPENPFTGKMISSEEKNSHEQAVLADSIYDAEINNGNTYLPGTWITVNDTIWNPDNWQVTATDSIHP